MKSPATFSEYKDQSVSEKITLVRMEASKRLIAWTVHSGNVYKKTWTDGSIVSVKDSGTAYTAVASIAAVVASTYFHDRDAGLLYLPCMDLSCELL